MPHCISFRFFTLIMNKLDKNYEWYLFVAWQQIGKHFIRKPQTKYTQACGAMAYSAELGVRAITGNRYPTSTGAESVGTDQFYQTKH